MDCFVGLLAEDVLGWWLLDLRIIGGIEVAGSLEINSLCMSIDLSYQLLHTWGIFLINSTSLTLHWRRGSWVWDLLWIPQWGIFGHSYSLEGC